MLAAVQSTDGRMPPEDRVLLAVSGGADSMALLHAMAAVATHRIAAVAVFDHGTGAHATAAADVVVGAARRMGLRVVHGRAVRAGRTEAEWRAARWAFLRDMAQRFGARVATAHTADDQLETMVQRWMRGTGTRGLAALAAQSDVVRPLLSVRRAAIRHYCQQHDLRWLEDPANADRRHLRVRLRLDVLPLYEAVDPDFAPGLLALGDRAAAWRAEVEAWAGTWPWQMVAPGVGRIERTEVRGLSAEALALLWPVWCASIGCVLDGPGTTRVVRFTTQDAPAGELQLPDGASLVRRGPWLEARSAAITAVYRAARVQESVPVRVGEEWTWPGWRLTPVTDVVELQAQAHDASAAHSADWAAFPRGAVGVLRRWTAGDHVQHAAAGASRGISRYLSEAGVPRLDRRGWPVVEFAGAVVWVPGVCRGTRAAPSRSGRSDYVWYRCVRAYP